MSQQFVLRKAMIESLANKGYTIEVIAEEVNKLKDLFEKENNLEQSKPISTTNIRAAAKAYDINLRRKPKPVSFILEEDLIVNKEEVTPSNLFQEKVTTNDESETNNNFDSEKFKPLADINNEEEALPTTSVVNQDNTEDIFNL